MTDRRPLALVGYARSASGGVLVHGQCWRPGGREPEPGRRNPGPIGPRGWRDEHVAGHADATQTIVPEPGGQDVRPRWGPRCRRETRRREGGAVRPGGDRSRAPTPADRTGPASPAAGDAGALRSRPRPSTKPAAAPGSGHRRARPPPGRDGPAPHASFELWASRLTGGVPDLLRRVPFTATIVLGTLVVGLVARTVWSPIWRASLVRRGRLRHAGAARGQDLDPAHRLVVLPHPRPVPLRPRHVRRHRRRLRDPARHPRRRDHRRRRRDRRDPAGVAAGLGAVGHLVAVGESPSRECATSASPRARSPSSR